MKKRALLLALAISTMIFYSCEGDLPPEKTVGNITFVITEENTPQTLSGVSIQLFSDDDPSVTPADRTDASGRCTFSNIPIGSYHLNLSKPGYESKEGLTLRVNGGDNPYKEISLKRTTTILTITPDVLDFGDNESVVQKAFSLVNPNYKDLTWAILDTDVPWIVSVCDKDGKKSGTIKYNQEVAMSVTIDRGALAVGNNESTIVVLSDYGRAELQVSAVGADRRFPITEITEVTDVELQTAIFKGKVLSVGAPEYEERGFVYSTSTIAEDATDGFTKIPSEMNSENTFSAAVNGLNKGTTYYVRAYGKNALGLKLSNTYKTFTTIETETVVSTKPIPSTDIDIINGEAKFGGTIIEVGNPPYSEKGFCYNTSGEPTVSDTKHTVSGTSGGDYYYSCAELATNTTYYVRAYAIQNDKIYYGTSVIFNTDMSKTSVSTLSATNVTSSSATLNGSIIKIGAPVYSEKGFCYSTNPELTINNSRKEKVSGIKEGDFSLNITGLDYKTTYYYKAYVIQNGTVYYGNRELLTTGYTPANVVNSDVSGIGYRTLTFNGCVTEKGDPPITECGFVYSVGGDYYNQPTIEDSKVTLPNIPNGDFKVTVDGLEENTEYWVCTYFIQGGKCKYGNVKKATTFIEPIVATGPVINIKLSTDGYYWEATFQGAFYDGNPMVSDVGFVYSESRNPTINDTSVTIDSITEIDTEAYKFTKTVTNLSPYKVYYLRAFVKNKLGYVYGEEATFITGN